MLPKFYSEQASRYLFQESASSTSHSISVGAAHSFFFRRVVDTRPASLLVQTCTSEVFLYVSATRVTSMAFVSSFCGAKLPQELRLKRESRSERFTPQASSRDRAGNNSSFPPFKRRRPEDFRPFDGSQPLLPPWRPPSVEAEFNYSARRIVSREHAKAESVKRVVKVESQGYGTLFAEVVQEVSDGEGKVWLRPLLLNHVDGATFVDLRGGSDVVLNKGSVSDVDAETKTRLSVNLMATESDLLDRALSDDRWNEVGSKALLAFMRRLSGSDGG